MRKPLSISLLAALVCCAGSNTNTPVASVPITGAPADTYDLADIIKDRTAAPNISSMRNNPVDALGTLYARVSALGKDCADRDPAASAFSRLLSIRKDACEVESKPASDQLVSKKVRGGAAASFKALLGSGAADANAAFEFFVTEPVSAYFKDSSKCYDGERVRSLTLPERTCEVYWIAGVVLTQVSTRSYREVAGKAEVAFTVLKIDGKAYYNTSDAVTRYLMTVDPIEVSQEFALKDGFLVKPRATRALDSAVTVPPIAGKDVPRLASEKRERHLQEYFEAPQ